MRSAYDFPRLFGLVPQAGTLDEGQAKDQIRVLEAIGRPLRRLAAEQRQVSLLGTEAYGGRMSWCRARAAAFGRTPPHAPVAPRGGPLMSPHEESPQPER